ncbi:hypothetical protein ACOMHN_023395 [Nucella lapillus]
MYTDHELLIRYGGTKETRALHFDPMQTHPITDEEDSTKNNEDRDSLSVSTCYPAPHTSCLRHSLSSVPGARHQ